MDLSIIIVNYNTKDLLKKCLKSVFASQASSTFEVLVSDNASRDGSIEMVKREFPQVRLIENKSNLGFSKANNVALRQAQGQYFLLLNSDTEVYPDTFNLSIKRMEQDENIGILGCKVKLPDGSLDKACRRRFPNPKNSFLRLFGLKKFSDYNIEGSIDQEQEVDAVMGAFLMIRKSVVQKVGYLDEDYFMYGEDLDWCWRVKKTGYEVIYFPEAEIVHYKYGSSQAIALKVVQWAHDAMWIFYKKNYRQDYSPAFSSLVFIGIKARMYMVFMFNFLKRKKAVH
ncbi:MAG: glycosyl transferase family 2 [Candidatus Doudnabacteria bacterium CG10_big_fil_rev_8_21_14_0_10_41_10]|uniref:Glycosyl transferase family 2 n=1 Tax=Candidatus Doudnabacteria bacterium CG10_big_fil_rev_8_21_14_0_10_41_10 TaxID=1974551 RepID=A0A2H0VE64_9BACT|nr:MAG: glycosyl transferase family 2 [Candidatus Doudnabacteria bacterium CG10_big_fil_rev_8_21_14_0_10_41_10]